MRRLRIQTARLFEFLLELSDVLALCSGLLFLFRHTLCGMEGSLAPGAICFHGQLAANQAPTGCCRSSS